MALLTERHAPNRAPARVASEGPGALWATRPDAAWLALVPALMTLVVGAFGLNSREMWEDEYATYHAATISWSALGRLLRHLDLVHAAYYVVLRGWIAVAGDSLLALRLPSLLAMAAAAAAVALLGRRLVNVWVGLTAGLVFALLPAVSRYAQEARSYALVTAGAALATLLLLRAIDRPTGRRFAGYGAVLVAVGLTHFVALLVVVPHAVYIVMSKMDERRRYRFAGTIGAVMLVVVPLPALASHQSSAISWVRADLATVQAFPAKMFLSAPVAWLVIPLALLGGLALRRRDLAAATTLLVWAIGPVLFTYLSFPWLHLFLPRYLLFTLPAWALLAAVAAAEVGRLFALRPVPWSVLRRMLRAAGPAGLLTVAGRVLRPGALPWGASRRLAGLFGAGALVLAVAVFGLPGQAAVRHSPVDGQPDYRSALAYVSQRQLPGDGIAYNDHFGGRSDLARAAAEYELRGGDAPRDVFLARTAASTGYFGAQDCVDAVRCLGDTTRVWLVATSFGPDPLYGLPQAEQAALHNGFVDTDEQSFVGVRVVLLVRPAAAPAGS
jgi:mannosyltransferase